MSDPILQRRKSETMRPSTSSQASAAADNNSALTTLHCVKQSPDGRIEDRSDAATSPRSQYILQEAKCIQTTEAHWKNRFSTPLNMRLSLDALKSQYVMPELPTQLQNKQRKGAHFDEKFCDRQFWLNQSASTPTNPAQVEKDERCFRAKIADMMDAAEKTLTRIMNNLDNAAPDAVTLSFMRPKIQCFEMGGVLRKYLEHQATTANTRDLCLEISMLIAGLESIEASNTLENTEKSREIITAILTEFPPPPNFLSTDHCVPGTRARCQDALMVLIRENNQQLSLLNTINHDVSTMCQNILNTSYKPKKYYQVSMRVAIFICLPYLRIYLARQEK